MRGTRENWSQSTLVGEERLGDFQLTGKPLAAEK